MRTVDSEGRTRLPDGYAFGSIYNLVSANTRLGVAAAKQYGGCMEVADNTAPAAGTGGGILFTGRYDSSSTLTTCASINAFKETGNAWGLMLQSRSTVDGGPQNRWLINGAGNLISYGGYYSIGEATARVPTGYFTTGNFTTGYFGTVEITSTSGLYLNSASSNLIRFNSAGVAAPTFTTRSAGTKIVLYPSLSASAADYGLGIESGTLWFSAPVASSTFKWYGGTTLLMSLTSENLVLGSAALSTGATNGFLYIRTTSGAPTGTPTAYSGRVPMAYDTANNHFYIYNGGWKKVALT